MKKNFFNTQRFVYFSSPEGGNEQQTESHSENAKDEARKAAEDLIALATSGENTNTSSSFEDAAKANLESQAVFVDTSAPDLGLSRTVDLKQVPSVAGGATTIDTGDHEAALHATSDSVARSTQARLDDMSVNIEGHDKGKKQLSRAEAKALDAQLKEEYKKAVAAGLSRNDNN